MLNLSITDASSTGLSERLRRIFRGSPARRAADRAYRICITQARGTDFYAAHGVPDTLDGRFELIVLHVFLILHRIRGHTEASRFGQALFDLMFADMDNSLREMGTGDLSVGKQVKRMATAFYGRTAAYQAALSDPAMMDSSLRRNLFGTVEDADPRHIAWFEGYIVRQSNDLANEPLARLVSGDIRFGPID